MKKTILFISLLIIGITVYAQDYQLTFTGSGAATTIDSVSVKNVTKNTHVSLGGNDILHLVQTIQGVDDVEQCNANTLHVYPNPLNEAGVIEFSAPSSGNATITVCDISGKITVQTNQNITQGLNRFKLSSIGKGVYTVQVVSGAFKYAGKFVSTSATGSATIERIGEMAESANLKKSEFANYRGADRTSSIVEMQYSTGNVLEITGYSGSLKTTMQMTPTKSQSVALEFNNFNWLRYSYTIQYAADGVTESFKDTTTYDDQARPINHKLYINGILTQENRDYTYNGNEATYYKDQFSNGSLSSTNKFKESYCSDWIRKNYIIGYDTNGITEIYKYITTYDEQGRVKNYKLITNGLLLYESRDYVYNGSEATCFYDSYTNDTLLTSTKMKTTYNSDWIRQTCYIIYGEDGVTEKNKSVSIFDSQGRIVDVKYYYQGGLYGENKDWVYNGNEATYNLVYYTDGVVTSTTKVKVGYYNN